MNLMDITNIPNYIVFKYYDLVLYISTSSALEKIVKILEWDPSGYIVVMCKYQYSKELIEDYIDFIPILTELGLPKDTFQNINQGGYKNVVDKLAEKADMIIANMAYFINHSKDLSSPQVTAIDLEESNIRFCFMLDNYQLSSSTIPPEDTVYWINTFKKTWEKIKNYA